MIMDKKVLTLLGITQPTTEEQIKYVDDLSNDISRIQHMINEFRLNTESTFHRWSEIVTATLRYYY